MGPCHCGDCYHCGVEQQPDFCGDCDKWGEGDCMSCPKMEEHAEEEHFAAVAENISDDPVRWVKEKNGAIDFSGWNYCANVRVPRSSTVKFLLGVCEIYNFTGFGDSKIEAVNDLAGKLFEHREELKRILGELDKLIG